MSNTKAFTLTELMVVIAVSAILMAVAVPTFIGARNRSNAQACSANLNIINSAIKEWALDKPDIAVANYAIKVSDINNYIDGNFSSLDEPVGGRYSQGQGADAAWDTDDDIVGTISGTGVLPQPVCSKGPSPGDGTYPDHVID